MPNLVSFVFTNHFLLTSFIITFIFTLSICPCESVWQSERIRPLSTSAPLAYHRVHLKSRTEATTTTLDASTTTTTTTTTTATPPTTTKARANPKGATEEPFIQIVNLSNFSNTPTIHHKKNADHLLESDVVHNNKVSTHGNQSPENRKKHHVSTGSYVNPLPAVRPRAPPPPPLLPVTTVAPTTMASTRSPVTTTATTKATPARTTAAATTKAATIRSSTWTSTSTLSPASVDYIGDPASPFMADLDDGVEYTYAEDSNEPLGSLSSLRSPSAASSPSSSPSSPSQTRDKGSSSPSFASPLTATSTTKASSTTECPASAIEVAREIEVESESESEINEPITLVPIDEDAAAEAVTSADDHERDVDEGANVGTGKDDESISPPAPISTFGQGDTNGPLSGSNEEHQGSHRRTPSSSSSSSSSSTFTSKRVASAVASRERKNRKEKRINSSRSSNNDQPGDGSDDQLEREESEASNTQASSRRKVKSSVSSGGSRARPTLRYLSAPLSDGRTSILIPLPQDLDEKTGVVFVEDIREGDLSKRTFRTHIFRPSQTSPISITLKPAITSARGSRTRGARHSSSSSSRGTSSSRINSLVKSIEPREPVAHARQTLTTLTVEDKLLGPSILSTDGHRTASSSSSNSGQQHHSNSDHNSFTSDNLLSDHNSERLIVSTTTTDTPRLVPSSLGGSSSSGEISLLLEASPSASTTAKPFSSSTGNVGDEVTRNSDSNPLSRGASRAMGSRRIPIKKLVASALKEEENSLHRSTTSTSTWTSTSTSTAAPTPASSQRPKASSMSAALTVSRAIDRIRPRTRVPSQPPVPPAPIRIVLSTPVPNVTHPLTHSLTHSSPIKPVPSEVVTTGNPSSSSSFEASDEGPQTDAPLEVEELSTTTTAPPTTTPSDLLTETTTWIGRVIHSHGDNNDPKNDLSLPSPFFVSEMRRKLTATRAPDARMSTLREPATTRDPVSSFSSSATTAPITSVPQWIAPVVETGSNRPRPGATSGGGRSGSRRANQITILTVTSDFSSFPSRVKSDASVNGKSDVQVQSTTTSTTSAPITIRASSTSRDSSPDHRETFSSSTTRRMAPSPPSTTPAPSVSATTSASTRTTARRNFVSNVTTSRAPVIPVISNSDAESNSDQENNDNIPLNVIGVPGVDYPVYHDIPLTNFDCRNVEYPGFYADLETGCQVYHSCGSRGGRRHSFICPNGTIFSQEYLICDWWFNVRCLDSHNYFSLNKEAFSSSRSSGPSSSSSTTTSTTESPVSKSTTLSPNDFESTNHTEISENESEEHVVSIADSASAEANESSADAVGDESGANTSIEDSSEEIIDSEVEVVSPAVLSHSFSSQLSTTTSSTTTPATTTATVTSASSITTSSRRRNNGSLGRRNQQQQQQQSTRNSISGIGRSANRNQLGN